MIQYALAFCQITIGLVFAWSVVGKVQDFFSFVQTINNFKLLPKAFHKPAALVFLGSELAVLLTMILGGKLLLWGFLLAGLLLMFFSIALISVLLRKLQIPCNCFGSSENRVSSHDVVRNIGFLLCAWAGYWTYPIVDNRLSIFAYILTGISAIVFVMISINLRTITTLLMELSLAERQYNQSGRR